MDTKPKSSPYVVSAQEVRAERERLGLSQRQVSERLGIAESTVWLYERKGGTQVYRYALAGLRLEVGSALIWPERYEKR